MKHFACTFFTAMNSQTYPNSNTTFGWAFWMTLIKKRPFSSPTFIRNSSRPKASSARRTASLSPGGNRGMGVCFCTAVDHIPPSPHQNRIPPSFSRITAIFSPCFVVWITCSTARTSKGTPYLNLLQTFGHTSFWTKKPTRDGHVRKGLLESMWSKGMVFGCGG